MANKLSGGYFPQYPHHDSLPDPEIRTLITNFYHATDNHDANELWISYFTKDAQVMLGNDTAKGEQEIRELRGRVWKDIDGQKHSVSKVFPALFQEPGTSAPVECEVMLFGEVSLGVRDGDRADVSWAGHAVVRKCMEGEREGWKLARYQVWFQKT